MNAGKMIWMARPGEQYHAHLFTLRSDGTAGVAICGVLPDPDDLQVPLRRGGRICVYCAARERPRLQN